MGLQWAFAVGYASGCLSSVHWLVNSHDSSTSCVEGIVPATEETTVYPCELTCLDVTELGDTVGAGTASPTEHVHFATGKTVVSSGLTNTSSFGNPLPLFPTSMRVMFPCGSVFTFARALYTFPESVPASNGNVSTSKLENQVSVVLLIMLRAANPENQSGDGDIFVTDDMKG